MNRTGRRAANSLGGFAPPLEGRQTANDGLGPWGPRPPLSDPDQLNRNGRDAVLWVSIGQPEVATLAQTTTADGVLVDTFSPGAGYDNDSFIFGP